MTNDAILHLLGLARKAGRLEVGEEPVGAAARGHEAKLILLAKDAAANTARRAAHFGDAGSVLWLLVPFTKSELGGIVGRGSCAMMAVTDYGFAASLTEKLAVLEPDVYTAAATQLREKADRVLQRQKEQRQHEKNVKQGKQKPWMPPPKQEGKSGGAQPATKIGTKFIPTGKPHFKGKENADRGGKPYGKADAPTATGDKPFVRDENRAPSGERKPYAGGGKSFSGERKPYAGGGKSFSGERKPYAGGGKSYSGSKPYAKSGSYAGGGKPYGKTDAPTATGDKPFVRDENRAPSGERKPYAGGGRSYSGSKPYAGGGKSFSGERKPYAGGGKSYSGSKPYAKSGGTGSHTGSSASHTQFRKPGPGGRALTAKPAFGGKRPADKP